MGISCWPIYIHSLGSLSLTFFGLLSITVFGIYPARKRSSLFISNSVLLCKLCRKNRTCFFDIFLHAERQQHQTPDANAPPKIECSLLLALMLHKLMMQHHTVGQATTEQPTVQLLWAPEMRQVCNYCSYHSVHPLWMNGYCFILFNLISDPMCCSVEPKQRQNHKIMFIIEDFKSFLSTTKCLCSLL